MIRYRHRLSLPFVVLLLTIQVVNMVRAVPFYSSEEADPQNIKYLTQIGKEFVGMGDPNRKCPLGFVQFKTSSNSHECLLPVFKYKKRNEAMKECAKSGSILFEVFNSLHQSALALISMLRGDFMRMDLYPAYGAEYKKFTPSRFVPVWLGLKIIKTHKKIDKKKVYKVLGVAWESGDTVKVNFMNEKIVNESDHNCVVSQGMFWYVASCNIELAFVCMKRKHCPLGTVGLARSGSCFKVFNEKVNFSVAFQRCAQRNYSLAHAVNMYDNFAIYLARFVFSKQDWVYLAFEAHINKKQHDWEYALALPVAANGTYTKTLYHKPSNYTSWFKTKKPKAYFPTKKHCIRAKFRWEQVACSQKYDSYVCRMPVVCPMIYLKNGNAQFVGFNYNGFGRQVVITCNPGYTIYGPHDLTCKVIHHKTGRSSFLNTGKKTACLKSSGAALCRVPEAWVGVAARIHDGQVVGNGTNAYVVGSRFTFGCKPGYVSKFGINGTHVAQVNATCTYKAKTRKGEKVAHHTFKPALPASGICVKQIVQ